MMKLLKEMMMSSLQLTVHWFKFTLLPREVVAAVEVMVQWLNTLVMLPSLI